MFVAGGMPDGPSLDCLVKLSPLCQWSASHQDFGAGNTRQTKMKAAHADCERACLQVCMCRHMYVAGDSHICVRVIYMITSIDILIEQQR